MEMLVVGAVTCWGQEVVHLHQAPAGLEENAAETKTMLDNNLHSVHGI